MAIFYHYGLNMSTRNVTELHKKSIKFGITTFAYYKREKEVLMEKKNRMSRVLELFVTMFKIGLFTFGGGYAMIAILEREFIENKGWIDHEEFMDLMTIAESTPGPIAINSATYLGYKTAGVLGSAFATLGVVLPSFIIIYIISLFFDAFLALTVVAAAFRGIQACVVYLILSAGIKLFKKMKKKPLNITVFLATFCCLVGFSLFAVKFSTIFYILIGALVGLVSYLVSLVAKKDKKEVDAE